MAYLAEQIREVRQRIADRRTAAIEAAEGRRREVEAKSPEIVKIDAELAKKWLANGAQPTDTVRDLFRKENIL